MGERLLITAPTQEPVSLIDLREHLRIGDADAEDTMLALYLSAVRRHIEEIASIAYLTQTWEWAQDFFPSVTDDNVFGAILLPGSPLQSVTSVKYIDTNGVEQTLSTALYVVNTRSQPGSVTPAVGESWPDTRWQPNAVVVKYVAGYLTPQAIPEDLRQLLLVAAGELYEYREDVIAGTANRTGLVHRLLAPHRIWA